MQINNTFQCTECNIKFAQYLQYTNYNNYQYAQIPNARPVTVVQQSPLYAQNEQIPINEIKYNNKKNKNLSNKSKKQNKKNDDIDLDEEEPEDINRINEIKNNNNNINEFSMINNNNNLVVDNVPQIIIISKEKAENNKSFSLNCFNKL